MEQLGASQADDCPNPAKIASDEAREIRIVTVDDDDVVRQVKFVVQRRAAIVKHKITRGSGTISVSKDGPLFYAVSKIKMDTWIFVPNVEGHNR
jgi:hypothetical protein